MSLLERFTRFMKQLSVKDQYKLIATTLIIVVFLILFFFYRFYAQINYLQSLSRQLQHQQKEAALLLSRYDRVLKQKEHVGLLLQKDNNFKIKEFFSSIVKAIGLAKALVKDPEFRTEPLVDGYEKIKIDAYLTGLNMQQVVDLLYKIEQNERVYVNDIKITATTTNPRTLDLFLVIATFEAVALQE